MPTYPPSYTQPPTPPNDTLQTGDAFDTAADNWNEWQVTNGTELPALALNTYNNAVEAAQSASSAVASASNAASSESVALAASNFKGSWSDLTGAYNVPSSVQHNGKYWMLLTDVADISLTEPSSVNPDWSSLTFGNNQLQAVANGAISDGSIVYLLDDGTVSIVPESSKLQSVSENVFNSGSSSYTSVTALDASTIAVVYQDGSNSNYGTAVIGSITGTTISFGSEAVFNASSSSYTSVTALDASTIAITYRDISFGRAIIGSVTGATISFGSEATFNSGSSFYTSVTALDASTIAIAYRDGGNSNYGTAVIGSITGTTISFGSEAVFNTATTSHISITALDASTIAVVYQGTNFGTANIGSVTGTTITFGPKYVFNTDLPFYTSVTTLDASTIAIAYRDRGNSDYGTSVIGSITGATISFGSEAVFNAGSSPYTSVTALDASTIAVVYQDGSNSDYGTSVIGSITGTTISFGSEAVFNTATTSQISITALDASTVAVVYQDGSNSGYGTCNALEPTSGANSFIGISSENFADGSVANIDIMYAIVENQSGLTTNSRYYIDDLNPQTLTTTNTGTPVGRALSSTKLLITGGA